MQDEKIEYPELYAIWKYDFFPYFLVGKITKFHSSGQVETQEFGRGRYFWPEIIVLKELAIPIKEKLQELEKERCVASKLFDKEWKTKIDDLFCKNECPLRAPE